MKLSKFTAGLAIIFLFTAAHGHVMYAQDGIDPDRLANLRARLSQVNQVLNAFPDVQKQTLSSGAQNLLTLAQGSNKVDKDLGRAALQQLRVQSQARSAEDVDDPYAFVSRISNPSTDFLFSIMTGFTQSETSTARCGNNVVVGFNDSGSFFESILFGPGGESFSGASFSTNSGASFRDIGYINPGSNPLNFMGGDPVVTCTVTPSTGGGAVATTFYYSQLFETGSSASPITAVALSKSTDGGATWGDPIAAAQKDALTHFLDKDWSATDPTNPGNIFVTYTDFDSSGATCGTSFGVPIPRSAIEIARTTDGGATWTSPTVIAEFCVAAPNYSSVQGSQVVVDSGGNVYVAWESFAGATGTTRALWVRRSTDHGVSFAPTVKIDNVVETGDGYALQGNFRNNEFPMMAVDRNSGALYVTWNDGRNFALPDLEAPDGVYHYADILISHSTDGGATWSPAVRVNGDPLTHAYSGQSRGTDHYMPGVAVDRTGAIGVCWYDRRNDPANLASNRFCSISRDGGATWGSNLFVNLNSPPWHATDAFINPYYLGDYDAVTSDFTLANSGFLGAYGFVNTVALVPNQDVGVISFP